MRLSITHDTTYRYEDRVRASIQYLRLTPQDSERGTSSRNSSNSAMLRALGEARYSSV